MPFSRVTAIGLFLSVGRIMKLGQIVELDLEVLRADLLAHRATFIDIEKRERRSFQKNLGFLYCAVETNIN